MTERSAREIEPAEQEAAPEVVARSIAAAPTAVERVMALQRTAGNRAVGRLLARQGGGAATAAAATAGPATVCLDEPAAYARSWSEQWAARDPTSRKRVLMKAGTPESVVTQLKAAIKLAGPGGRLVFNVGHGSLPPQNAKPTDGWFDLAPSHAFVVGGFLVKYGEREGVPNSGKDPFVDVFYDYPMVQGQPSDKAQFEKGLTSGKTAERRAKNWAVYMDLCKAFEDGKIARVYLLTCRIGKAEMFLRKVAYDWRTMLIAYKDRMMLDPRTDKKGKTRIRMRLEHDPEGQKTNTPASEEEIPLGTDENSVRMAPRGGV